jgi:Homeodomain-like domain
MADEDIKDTNTSDTSSDRSTDRGDRGALDGDSAMIRERVIAGLARAKAQGTPLGRPQLEDSDPDKVKAIKAALTAKWSLRRIARELGVGVCTVYRIRDGAP